MTQYSADGNIAFYCGYKFRRDPKTGYYLCTRKTDMQRRERLHVFVWRKNNGDIPEGYHIHHVDGDKRNNEIENLHCVKGTDHVSYHGKERAAVCYEAMRKSFLENVIPAAKEWHGSEEGKRWHSEHAKATMNNIEKKEFRCEYCGSLYYSMPIGMKHKYCSNNCKTKARKESGVDNEERACKICGEVFVCNKYQKTATCSQACKNILRANRKRQMRGA